MRMSKSQIKNMKTVFITGSASGIGLATAKMFAAKGYVVGLYDINEALVKKHLKDDLFKDATGAYCDVTDRASISAALADFSNHAGERLDVLVNNAGVLSSDWFSKLKPEQHDLMIDVNVKGFTHVAQLAYPYLKQTEGSTLVNLCSASSIHGIPFLAVYSATKFFVNGLSEALSLEWEQDDIRVVAIKPPVLNNRMGDSVKANLTQKMTVDMSEEDVVHQIWKSLQGDGLSYPVGLKAKLWFVVDSLLPEKPRQQLVKYLVSL